MGVHGITSFLKERGLLPPSKKECCSTKLWNEWAPSMAFGETTQGPPLQVIPPNSSLLVDGNGLAFYLHRVAYARHVRSVTRTAVSETSTCPQIKSLKKKDIVELLPCMMPLELLSQVTTEYVSGLRQQNIHLRFFWDGPGRRFKAATSQKRKLQRQEEWAALQTFCVHGALSLKKTDPVCQCHEHFPRSALFLQCVRHAIRSCSVDMVQCQEEADVELALQASGDPNAFILGQDSDFVFYKDVQYIPFDGLYISPLPSIPMQAVCIMRSKLADSLALYDEEMMVELAILLGNDYVDQGSLAAPSDSMRTVAAALDFLRAQSEDFQVQSHHAPALELEYVRCLYNLESIDSFPLDDSIRSRAEKDPTTEITKVVSFPRDFPFHLAKISRQDNSVRDVVSNCLQVYIDQSSTDDTGSVLEMSHLDAYQASTLPSPSTTPLRLEASPRWADMQAAYIIETCVAMTLQSSAQSLLGQITSPASLMSQLQFHAILASLRPNGKESMPLQSQPSTTLEPKLVERPHLPIDEYEELILTTIKNNRVTIIHGETGCGKSSRVPVMILEAPPPEPSQPEVKIFISQPRRIAAASLVERVRSCEPKHRDKFAVRMGHGYREYESNKTQAWFVTTGYLTRLLANHPERFNDCTHLIIDEVHERSVDTDILCLLCRRLLNENKTIRLVLMSATLATKLYKDYFQVPSDPIHVGVRRFPIEQFFVEDLSQFKLPPTEVAATKAIVKECEAKRCNSPPSQSELSKRFSLAARLATIVGVPGSSVLIFVPGMNEIISITESIEKFYRPGIRYTCFPIHSDIPFEEQMGAFDAPEEDEVKVIIATNAAESSVTLPAVDHVICLGLCRQIVYNESSHRQMLTAAWISKASATQRAGRTGRVRPGNVYRLYTRQAYDHYMNEFEPGEMVRIPLDSVILMLKEMLGEEVKPVLMDCIEPPRMDTIDRSFQSLHRWNFLSEPNDLAQITTLGSFVSALGVDLALGSFIGLGIQFGVAAEAIEMAAIMSFPKSPFQISNPLFHDAAVFNEIASRTYVSKCHFDANLYSDPLGLMNALWDYHVVPNKRNWCVFYRFAQARMSQLCSTRNSLRKRVADFLGVNEDKLQVESPPAHMPKSKVTILRILKVWVFSETIIECSPTKIKGTADGSVTLSLPGKSTNFATELLDQVLIKDRHPFSKLDLRFIEQAGDFAVDGVFSLKSNVATMEKRLISYMCEVGIDAACLADNEEAYIYLQEENIHKPSTIRVVELASDLGVEAILYHADLNQSANKRGVLERKCGSFLVTTTRDEHPISFKEDDRNRIFRRFKFPGNTDVYHLIVQCLQDGEASSVLALRFLTGKRQQNRKKKASRQQFKLDLRGKCRLAQKVDIQDLLGVAPIYLSTVNETFVQSIHFPNCLNKPYLYKGAGKELMATSEDTAFSSWHSPIINNIPEGARVLSVLASGQRKGGHRLRFPGEKDKSTDDPEATVDIMLRQEETKISKRWHKLGNDSLVFVQEDTVPASATSSQLPLYACCANSLDLRGGGMKVESVTLLPPNPLFLLLSLLSFGLEPNVPFTWSTMKGSQDEDGVVPRKKLSKRAFGWLRERMREIHHTPDQNAGDLPFQYDQAEAQQKIERAIDFHESCTTMGEDLVCFPDKAGELCKLFSHLDGGDYQLWESIHDKAVTPSNLSAWRREKKSNYKSSSQEARGAQSNQSSSGGEMKSPKTGEPSGSSLKDVDLTRSNPLGNKTCLKREPEKISGKWRIIRSFGPHESNSLSRLFATDLDDGEQVSKSDFPSTNILALLVRKFLSTFENKEGMHQTSYEKARGIGLDSLNWEICEYDDGQGPLQYQAKFISTLVPVVPIFGRGKNKLPRWMKKHMRPHRVEDANACVPPNLLGLPEPRVALLSKDRPTLVFESIESALRMEAAFYLESQFAYAGKTVMRHWYDHNFDEMLNRLVNLEEPAPVVEMD